MDILYCIIIFMMGTVFGSFFTLAVYRIPLGLDITHERSFCPNCNHKLEFKDLIPILSYIFLGGKCRYCGKHIRIRYLLLEIFSGLIFLIAYLSFNLTFPMFIENFEIEKIVAFIAFVFFYITVVLISGIDKEKRYIEKYVLIFGILTEFVYILYLYVLGTANLYRYGMYLVIMLILFIIDTITLMRKTKSYYLVQILMFFDFILIFADFKVSLIILVVALIYMLIYKIYKNIKFNLSDKADITYEQEDKKISFIFCLGVSSVLVCIINNFILYFNK